MTEDPYSAAEVDAAVAALQDPERLAHARDVVAHAAPSLQRVLNRALLDGGWFADAHRAQVREVATVTDAEDRRQAIETLVAEETRLGMLVGVTVGFELAHELRAAREASSAPDSAGAPAPPALKPSD
ncbi:MAG TPA: hypothetical protein VGN69_10870 [Solirubrobacteraceae bacterium]|nr:hypothetical protein [Solirubrobacteraceae bacterium]